jgi:hypothetical protein
VLDYQIDDESSRAEHRPVMEEVRVVAERAGFQLIGAPVCTVVSRATEGAVAGAAAGLLGGVGVRVNNPWVVLLASGGGGVVGHLVGRAVQQELFVLVGAPDEYGRWWLQASMGGDLGLQPSCG